MKRLCVFILTVLLALSCSGCKSREEKELERAREAAAAAEEAYWHAKEDYDQLVRDIERYNQLVDALNNAD